MNERIQEMAHCVAALARSGRTLRRGYDGGFVDDSPASSETQQWVAAGELADQYSECLDLALKSLFAAEDCMFTAASSAIDLEMTTGAIAAMRTSLEASSQTFRLLEPDLAVVERVKRFMRLTSESVSESRGMAALLKLPEDHPHVIKLDDIEKLVSLFGTKHGGLGEKTVRTQRVSELLTFLQVKGGGPRLAYSWMSGMAHADKVGLDNLMPGRMPAAGARDAYLVTLERIIGWFLWGIAFGYAAACDRAVRHFGWDERIWESAVEHWTECVRKHFADIANEVRDDE